MNSQGIRLVMWPASPSVHALITTRSLAFQQETLHNKSQTTHSETNHHSVAAIGGRASTCFTRTA
eukprot:1910657-Amphidinium_carterae.1